MKTAISLKDELFQAVERYADKTHTTRSGLIADAVREYLALRGELSVSDSLNAVYGESTEPLDDGLAQMQARTLRSDTWQ
ncbi:MAG TPA: ribbon-helix-helix domain-containing protein [Spirochaetota bacterium]|nr:ribbon-helix-helix domain-containing protein [Spirochaetota bacterium]HPN81815.1 ribbon-helix-helix domain-containing protein [Spirochaetota bacterium]